AIATGLYSVSSASGNVVALFTANTVLMPLTGNSWRLSLAVFGLVALVAAAAWVIFAREADFTSSTAGDANMRTLARFKEVALIPPVRIMLVMSIGIFMFGHGTTNWLPTLLHRQGHSKSAAGVLSSLPTIFGIVTALAATNFVARGMGREFKVVAVIFAAGALAEALIPMTGGVSQI